MVAMEYLETLGGRFVRYASTVAAIVAQPESFEEYVAEMGKHSIRVTAVTHLEGNVVNKAGGRLVMIVNTNEWARTGTGFAVQYALIWVNPVGVTLTPEVRHTTAGHYIHIGQPQSCEIGVDWDQPNQLVITAPSEPHFAGQRVTVRHVEQRKLRRRNTR